MFNRPICVNRYRLLRDIPPELWLFIFVQMGLDDLSRLRLTCKRFNFLINESHLWRELVQKYFPQQAIQSNPVNYKEVFQVQFARLNCVLKYFIRNGSSAQTYHDSRQTGEITERMAHKYIDNRIRI